MQPSPATLLKKETLTQVFSSEFYEISKNTCSTEHLWTTASDISVELPKNYQYNHSLKIKFLVFCKDFVTILIECFWFIWHRKNTLKLPKWLLPAIASVSLWKGRKLRWSLFCCAHFKKMFIFELIYTKSSFSIVHIN